MFGDPQDINAARLISSPDVEKINVYSLESSWDRQGSVYIVYFTLSAVMSAARVPHSPFTKPGRDCVADVCTCFHTTHVTSP